MEADWLRLVSAGAAEHIFLTPQWARVWWESLGAGDLRLLKLEENGRLAGLVPLMEKSDGVTLLGDKDVCDYLDALALPGREGKVVEALLRDGAGARAALDLFPLRPDSVLWQNLPQCAAAQGYTVGTEVIDVSFTLELPSTWEAYLGLLKGKDRHELKRKLRNLQQAGEARFCSGAPRDADMDDFLHLFRISRDDKKAFLTPEREAFFRRLARGLGDWVRVGFLELDGKRVAATLCFDFNGTVYLYNSGYDPDFAPLSVGLLCKAMTIKEAIENGRKTYDFLRGAEDYKFHLGGKPFSIYRLQITDNR
ncbi:MAG: GNAT family N-acetyltransferase [Chloroflexi bacterium]|nr:GNAT family N-acetyltransferase [Chloroflexota bacterium]